MPTNRDITNFVREFVGRSDRARKEFVPIWSEVLENYLVRPPGSIAASQDTAVPFFDDRSVGRDGSNVNYLKDPETRQVVDTYLSKFMVSLFGDDHFIAAKKRGREDATKAETSSNLVKYTFNLDGHYRCVQTWLLDMLLFGTGITQLGWKLIERPRTFRDVVGVDSLGNEIREEVRIPNYPYYDDPRLINIDIMDFYPDFGVDQLRDMVGAAKRADVTGFELMQTDSAAGWDKEAIKIAIQSAVSKASLAAADKGWRVERAKLASRHPGFQDVEVFEYYGEVPYKYADGERWRVITVAGDQVLRDRPWFFDEYRLPFYDATISPIGGRFYGLSPAEGARYQQDFADFLLQMMADAVARTVRPPIIYDRDAGIDPATLSAWRPDAPIGIEYDRGKGVNSAITTLDYTPNMNNGFAMFQHIKQSIRENTGAFGSIQGAGLGINRASATEAERTFQMALDRPEMFGRYLEKECLPPLGRGILKLYQQELETTEELTDRIGESPEPAVLADIQGDHDVQFVGSRNHSNTQARVQFIDRVIQLGSIPQLANLIDWKEIGIQMLEGMGFDKIAQGIATPDTVAKNLLIQGLSAQGGLVGNGNGETPSVDQTNNAAEAAGNVIPFSR